MENDERWLPVCGFPKYSVSTLGRVRNDVTGKMKAIASNNARKYPYVLLSSNKTKSVHRLVLEAFRGPPPPGMEANHRDGNKENNCLSNLEWVTSSENSRHAIKTGLVPPGFPRIKLSKSDVVAIRELSHSGINDHVLSRRFNVGTEAIRRVRNGTTWKSVTVAACE